MRPLTPASRLVATTTSVGSGIFALPNSPRSSFAANSSMSFSCSDLPTLTPDAARIVFAMPPPKISSSTFVDNDCSTSIFVETFEPPMIAISGRFGLSSALPKRLELGDEQRARARDGCVPRDAVRARLRAMRRAERVHDEHVAERRHAFAQLLVVGFLADVEAHVLAQHELAGLRRRRRPSQFAASGTLRPSSSPSFAATGASEAAGSGLPSLGRPRCDMTMTRAPASSAERNVGNAASSRAVLVTLPSLTGTFKSSRISTRLPCSA